MEAKVGVPFAQAEDPPDLMQNVSGIWDTGASRSGITRRVAEALSLEPTGMTTISTASGTCDVNTYLVSLLLPSRVWFGYLPVSEAELRGIDMLIGMDVIRSGDFAVTTHGGVTVCTYRVPSVERIDFVKRPPPKPVTAPKPKKQSRNSPCFCGSGEKYKTCHGRK